MASQRRDTIIVRFAAALALAALVGASDQIIERLVTGPMHGMVAGVLAGMIIREWWAVLVAPIGMVSGWLIATIVTWLPVWIHPFGWVTALPLCVLAAVAGLYLGRGVESITSRMYRTSWKERS